MITEYAKAFRESVPVVPITEREFMDPTAPNASTGVVNGRSSNVVNWDDSRFKWTYPMYKRFLGNFWSPFEINMQADKKDFPNLTEDQQDTFLKIIGLLAFLDSLQTDYSGKIADALTDSHIQAIMIILAQQEVVHNHSYSFVLASVAEKKVQDEVFEYWKHDAILKERNQFVLDGYNEFKKNYDVASILSSIAYDVVLEGLFFYSAFAFFYDLARNGLMVGASTMINYINKDEQQHVNLFVNIFRAILNDNPEFDTPELHEFVIQIFRKAALLEIEWSEYVIGNKFETIDVTELAGYIKFIANLRVKMLLGHDSELPFPKQETNPMEWIKFYEDVDLGRTDFFEQKSRQYQKADDRFNDTEEIDFEEMDLDI